MEVIEGAERRLKTAVEYKITYLVIAKAIRDVVCFILFSHCKRNSFFCSRRGCQDKALREKF